MRVLLLSPFVPSVRAPHGGGVYLATLCRALARRASIGLAAFTRPGEPPATGDGSWAWQGVIPLEDRPVGGSISLQTHRLRMLWRWRRSPLVAAKHWDPRMPVLLERARREFQPDVVLVELAQMAQYLPFLAGVPTILTDHEGGCPSNTTTGLGACGDRRDRRLWAGYMRHYYPLASLVQTLTAEDAETLRTVLGREVLVRPPAFDLPAQPVAPGSAPPRVLFLGDYSHGPNPEAAAMLANEVLPMLRAGVPATELWLAGPNQARLDRLAHVAGVRLLGFVPDLQALFAEVRLLLAPLLSGGGFRMKAVAALAHGLPVVTNRLGARGCDAPAPARVVVEGPQALAAAALELLRSPTRAAEAGQAAFRWARAHLDGEAVAALQLERAGGLLALTPQ